MSKTREVKYDGYIIVYVNDIKVLNMYTQSKLNPEYCVDNDKHVLILTTLNSLAKNRRKKVRLKRLRQDTIHTLKA